MYIIFNIIHVFFFLVKNSKKSSLCFSKTHGLTQYFFRKRLKNLFLQKGLDWRICVFEGKSVAATAQGGLCSGLATFDPVRAGHLPLLPRWQSTRVPSPASGMWLPPFRPHWWSGRAKKLSMPGAGGLNEVKLQPLQELSSHWDVSGVVRLLHSSNESNPECCQGTSRNTGDNQSEAAKVSPGIAPRSSKPQCFASRPKHLLQLHSGVGGSPSLPQYPRACHAQQQGRRLHFQCHSYLKVHHCLFFSWLLQ